MVQQAKEGTWLYQDHGEHRAFMTEATIINEKYLLPECTDEEKIQWEKDHPIEEPKHEEINR